MSYSELYCISNFSFLRGASHPEELVRQAAQLNYKAIAITDECSLAGVVRAHCEAELHDIELIIGSEFFINDWHFTLLAPNREAYGELSAFISHGRRQAEKGNYQLSIDALLDQIQHCLMIWFTPFHQISQHPTQQLSQQYTQQQYTQQQYKQQAEQQITTLLPTFQERLWLGESVLLNGDIERERLNHLRQLQTQFRLPIVACGGVYMHNAKRQPLQDTLTAIRLGSTVQSAGYALQSNHERYLRPIPMLEALYPDDLIAETETIRKRCDFKLTTLRYEYPQELVPPHLSAPEHLRLLVEEGVQRRWPKGASAKTLVTINKELALIRELQYEYYFLTVYDIVNFARSQNILCQGRGSAANSVVCFCLGITEVDPEKVNLLFERFISKERNEPPDIDIDFEHQRREEVIQFIYQKYGRQRAALTATVITYRRKSAIRDLGRALGFDQSLIDHLLKSLAWWDHNSCIDERLEQANIDISTPLIQQFKSLFMTLLRFPRHLSQHVGGFVISQGALDQLVPIENAAMPERTIIQWDKDDIEALGLLKVDVLGLGMLSAIHRAFNLIEGYRGERWSMSTLPQEDPAVYTMLQRGDSIGLFQVESRAQMSMLPRLKPKTFYDLVIEVAIVRPGPIQGKMVHPYLKRRDGEEAVEYPSEAVKSVLQRTLGIPIFQEQVIQLAMVAADFSAGEADQLRRSMASWRRKGELQRYKQQLIEGMRRNGYSSDFSEKMIEQINGFAEYGFPESHAASFALLVYVSAWLKRYEPSAFYCALLNSQPMGFYSASQLIQDARRHQVPVIGVDAQFSQWDHTLTGINHTTLANHRPAIRLGLRLIKGLSKCGAERVIQIRDQHGLTDIDQLAQQAELNKDDLNALANANALASLLGHRYQAHWSVLAVERNNRSSHSHQNSQNNQTNRSNALLPQLEPKEQQVQLPAPTVAVNMFADYASTGLSLNSHPMSLLRHQHPFLQRCKRSNELSALTQGRFVRLAGLVTGRQRPSTASGTLFVTLEDECGNSNIIIWPQTFERFRPAILHGKLLYVKGTIEQASATQQVTHIIAGEIKECSHLLEDLQSEGSNGLDIHSRDFH